MQKLLLTLLIAAGTITSFRAAAQSPTPTMAYELYFFNDDVDNFTIETFNYSVTSSQKPSIFGTPYTYTVSGETGEPVGLIDYGGYWYTPSSTQPLTITVNSGLTATVKNTSTSAQSFRMAIEFAPTRSFENPTIIYGPYTNVPGGATGTLTIPTGSTIYNDGALISLYPSEPYPVPIAFFISY